MRSRLKQGHGAGKLGSDRERPHSARHGAADRVILRTDPDEAEYQRPEQDELQEIAASHSPQHETAAHKHERQHDPYTMGKDVGRNRDVSFLAARCSEPH